ncbi:MAG: tape measure protein [Anaerolineae bacterium]|nr:tape measure protein [Anaerolineae bacterium]
MADVANVRILLEAAGGNAVLRELSDVDNSLNRLASSGSSAGGTMSNFGAGVLGGAVVAGAQLAVGALSSLAGMVGSMAQQALDATISYESMAMSLQSLSAREMVVAGEAASVGDAFEAAGSRAAELLEWTQALAISSPFSQEGVTAALRMAMNYGFTTEEAQRLTQATIDFAAATGAGTDAMSRISNAFGKMRSTGKASMESINMLVDAGVPAMQILRDTFNMTGDELQRAFMRGEISADAAIEAITSSLETDFAGAAARTTNTIGGLMSSLADVKDIGLRELFSGVFASAQPALAAFASVAMNDLVPAMKEIGQQIGDVLAPALQFVTGLLSTGDFSALLNLLPPEIRDGLPQLASAFESLGASLMTTAPQMQDAIAGIGMALQTSFSGNAPQVMDNLSLALVAFGELWATHGPAIIAVVTTVAQVLIGTLGSAFTMLSGIVAGALVMLNGDFLGGFGLMNQTAETAANSFLAIWGTNLAEVRATWASNFEMIGLIVSTVLSNIQTGITNTIQGVKATIVNGLMAARTAVLETINGWVDLGRQIVDSIVAGILNTASALYATLANIMKSAITAAINALQIGSPSKPFLDMGVNIISSFALGAEKEAPATNAAIGGTMNGAVASAGAALPAVSGGGGGGTTNNVTITVMAQSFDDIVREAAARGYEFAAVA